MEIDLTELTADGVRVGEGFDGDALAVGAAPDHAVPLGAELTDFPSAPVSDGAGHVVGLASTTGGDGGAVWSVVSWDVATGQRTVVAGEGPFATITPRFATGAVVR